MSDETRYRRALVLVLAVLTLPEEASEGMRRLAAVTISAKALGLDPMAPDFRERLLDEQASGAGAP
jgi:hypothetical protein